MSISQEELEIGRLIAPQGRLDHLLTPDLEKELLKQIEAGHHHLIIDLSAVTYINSGGLRCLITAWRRARKQGGDLLLCGLSARLQELFKMVGFDNVFRIYPDRDSAVEAWSP